MTNVTTLIGRDKIQMSGGSIVRAIRERYLVETMESPGAPTTSFDRRRLHLSETESN